VEWVARAARELWTPLILAGALFLTYYLISEHGSTFYRDIAARFFVYVLIVLALQIFSGNSGVLSFGHVAFMACGAYMSALLTIPPEIKEFTFLTFPKAIDFMLDAELGTLEATLAGGGFAMIVALAFSAPIVRLAGVQAGIGTLAILVIVNVFNVQTTSITRGTSTMIGVPPSTTFQLALVWAVIFVIVAFVFQQSRIGLRLRASRENERAARSVGVGVSRERAVAFTLSGFVCGAAGALYGHYFVTFSPYDFYFDITFLTLAMLVVGGMTSVTGAVVGCYLLTVVSEAFRRWEVNGLANVQPPSGTANLIVAFVLLVALIVRTKGVTGGREIGWPGDWTLPRPRLRRRGAPLVATRASSEA
jgi:branched-chain amino acid transport system permease protein